MIEWIFSASGTGRTGTIQQWTVPSSGLYRITAYGAQGGGNTSNSTRGSGTLGAKVAGVVTLEAGQVVDILVGQRPGTGLAGGGGSFVVINTGATPTHADILMIAGGGGSDGGSNLSPAEKDGRAALTGGTFSNIPRASDGEGGAVDTNSGGGGGGLLTDGGGTGGAGKAFVNGGEGAYGQGGTWVGGFGGGGARNGSYGGGGGGGYSGGAASGDSSSRRAGGGGGSFNAGTEQDDQAGVNEGDGSVAIVLVSNGRISGVVVGEDGPTQKEVYIYSRDDGSLITQGLSDSETGEFSFELKTSASGEHFVVALDKETNKNALIYDQIVAEAL